MPEHQGKHVMLHFAGSDSGGVKTIAEAWYRGFSQAGVRTSFLMDRDESYCQFTKKEGRECYCANLPKVQSRSWKLLGLRLPDLTGLANAYAREKQWRKTYIELLEKARPDVVLGNGYASAGIIGPACKATNTPLVVCKHVISAPKDPFSLRRRLATRLLNRYCSKIIGVSHLTIKELIPHLKIHHDVIHNASEKVTTSEEQRKQFRSELNIQANEIVFGSASRITPLKAIHRFIEAACLLLEANPNLPLRFLFAGKATSKSEEQYLTSLLQQIDAHGHSDAIQYVGFRKIEDLYSGIDIFCHTHSRVEPLGLSVIEAISAGLPSIVCDQGGFLEVMPKELAVRYQSSSSEALYKSMQQMLSPEFRETQSRLGKDWFDNEYLTFDQWIEQWLTSISAKAPLQ